MPVTSSATLCCHLYPHLGALHCWSAPSIRTPPGSAGPPLWERNVVYAPRPPCRPLSHQTFPPSLESLPLLYFYFSELPRPKARQTSALHSLAATPPLPHPLSCLLPPSVETGRWRTLCTVSWCNVTLPSKRRIFGSFRPTSTHICSRRQTTDSLRCPVGVCLLYVLSPPPPYFPPNGLSCERQWTCLGHFHQRPLPFCWDIFRLNRFGASC